MSTASYFPGIFAIKRVPGYKLYTNKVFENTNIVGTVSVTGHILENMYYYSSEQTEYSGRVKKWYGGEVLQCQWMYTGRELSVKVRGVTESFRVPVLYISNNAPKLFPSGSDLIVNTRQGIHELPGPSVYSAAVLYQSDPYSEVALPLPAPLIRPQQPVSTSSTIPIHVKRIVIQDAIRKAEPCAISYNDITEENASMTSCGHVFTTEAITRWLSQTSSNGYCPVCKQKCHLA